jgi:hypothetical protein
MTSRSTRVLTALATAASGLFGSLWEPANIAIPAFRRLPVQAWADYLRHADVGNGLVAYAGGIVLMWMLVLAAAASYFFRDRSSTNSAALPLALAIVFTLGNIATTIKAAPIMLNVAQLGDNQALLQGAFAQFTLWGIFVRGDLGALAFFAMLWALVDVHRPPRPRRTPATEAH